MLLLAFLPTTVNWDPNEILCNEKRPIRNWRRRTVFHPLQKVEKNKLKVPNTDSTAPLIPISEKTNIRDYNDGQCSVSLYCPL